MGISNKKGSFDIVGLSNALTDIICEVNYQELNQIKNCKDLLGALFSSRYEGMIPAGSPANTIYSMAKLGITSALLGTVAPDNVGKNYINALNSYGITSLLNKTEGKSGVCYIAITPDCVLHSFLMIGVAPNFDYDLSNLKSTKIFHTSCYELWSNPDKTLETIDYIKSNGAKLSLDLASAKAIENTKDYLKDLLPKVDILFATDEECFELTTCDGDEGLVLLSNICPVVVLKSGKNGSKIKSASEYHKIPIYPVKVANTNGAGDNYAAGFLFGYLKKLPIHECGHLGSYVASRVCAMKESHL